MVENPLPLSGVSPLEAGATLARSPVRNKCNRTAVAWKVREDSNFPQRFNSYLIGALDRHGYACAIERAGRPSAAATAIRFADAYGAFCGWNAPPADRFRSTRGSRMQDSRRGVSSRRPAARAAPLPASPEPSGLPPPRSGCQWPRARSSSTSPLAHHGQIARDRVSIFAPGSGSASGTSWEA